MLTIKRVNGQILYNYQEKRVREADKQDILIPSLKRNFNSDAYIEWYNKKKHYVNYIVDLYMDTASSFHDENRKYRVSFGPELRDNIKKWIFESSTH